MSEATDHDQLIKLTEEVKNLTKAVEGFASKMEEYSRTFVPRSEFDTLSILVKGVQGTGGMVKEMERLKEKVTKYAVIAGIVWFIFVALTIAGWQYYLARFVSNCCTTTTNNTINK